MNIFEAFLAPLRGKLPEAWLEGVKDRLATLKEPLVELGFEDIAHRLFGTTDGAQVIAIDEEIGRGQVVPMQVGGARHRALRIRQGSGTGDGLGRRMVRAGRVRGIVGWGVVHQCQQVSARAAFRPRENRRRSRRLMGSSSCSAAVGGASSSSQSSEPARYSRRCAGPSNWVKAVAVVSRMVSSCGMEFGGIEILIRSAGFRFGRDADFVGGDGGLSRQLKWLRELDDLVEPIVPGALEVVEFLGSEQSEDIGIELEFPPVVVLPLTVCLLRSQLRRFHRRVGGGGERFGGARCR